MGARLAFLTIVAAWATIAAVEAQVPPPSDKEPVLRLEAGGPTSFVTSLAFGADGKTLYAAGFDKVVRVWNLAPKTGEFVLDRAGLPGANWARP